MAADLVIAVSDEADADFRRCADAYYAELARRFEGGFDPGSTAYAGAPDASGAEVYLVARAAGQPVGCGMLRTIAPGIAEVKRVWTAPEARGLGVAKAVMDRIEELAAGSGHGAIRLDTNRALTEAVAFYGRRGYLQIERYNDNPYADHWFEKRLDRA